MHQNIYLLIFSSSIQGRKLIIWLGGGFQNQPYNVQVERIHSLSQVMSGAFSSSFIIIIIICLI